MESLNKKDSIEYTPIKGDNVCLEGRYGILLDNEFNQILWTDNEEITDWLGDWLEFLEAGGFIVCI